VLVLVALGALKVGKLLFLKAFFLQLYVGTVQPYLHISATGRPQPRIMVRISGEWSG
jgi:hypothetical protein